MREERNVCSAKELDKGNDYYVVIQAFNTSIFVPYGFRAFSQSVIRGESSFAARTPAM
jgi:hypothetical protein